MVQCEAAQRRGIGDPGLSRTGASQGGIERSAKGLQGPRTGAAEGGVGIGAGLAIDRGGPAIGHPAECGDGLGAELRVGLAWRDP